MAWDQVAIEIQSPSCPYAQTLQRGQRIQCRRPGDGHGIATVEGCVPGWQDIGGGLSTPKTACSGCPVMTVHATMQVECADVLPGRVVLHGACRDRQAVLRTYQALKHQGASLRRVRRADDQGRSRFVDLGGLSARQWEALEHAAAMGYFRPEAGRQSAEELASRMGCGKSAAHEHLRKALDQVLAALMAHGTDNHA